MFQDWHKKKNANYQVSKHLLWEYDLSHFDWNEMRTLVVLRVIERGRPEDFYAILNLYGGMRAVKNIIKEIPIISSPKDIAFVCSVFNLKKEKLRCYIRKQSHLKL